MRSATRPPGPCKSLAHYPVHQTNVLVGLGGAAKARLNGAKLSRLPTVTCGLHVYETKRNVSLIKHKRWRAVYINIFVKHVTLPAIGSARART